jgi:hypothetical protein
MYVRWKRRLAARGNLVLTAALVRSERRNGKPRQTVVAYLGSVNDLVLKHILRRNAFWEEVNRRLDALVLDPLQRKKIESNLASMVSRPSPEEVAKAQRDFEKAQREFEEFLGPL